MAAFNEPLFTNGVAVEKSWFFLESVTLRVSISRETDKTLNFQSVRN